MPALKYPDITGKRFERLIVIKLSGKDYQGHPLYEARCDCGVIVVVMKYHLLGGRTRSCGCLKRDLLSANNNQTIHGERRHDKTSTEYHKWIDMKTRCCNSKIRGWKNYGGRGITVCDRWLNSFENFLADMGRCPDGLTLDRKNNDGNYESGNCRWATIKEQNNNRRKFKDGSQRS
jgi:hypothetical protein